MKKIIIAPIVEGWGSLAYRRDHLFAPVVRREIAKFSQVSDLEVWDQDFISFGPGSQRNVLDWIEAAFSTASKETEALHLAIFAKSKGAIEGRELIMKQAALIWGSSIKKIALCMIDPHGAIAGDGNVGPYNKDRDIFFSSGERRSISDGRFFVSHVYQQHANPTGAACPGANRSWRVDDPAVDHFNIVQRPETEMAIRLALEFVIS